MRISLLLAAAVSAVMAASAAASPQLELGAGVSFTNRAAVAWLPSWHATERGTLRAEVGAVYVRGRARHSRRDNTASVSAFHAGIRYEHHSGFVAGFGAGAQHGKTSALSGGPQFITSLGWQRGPLSLLVRHISNNCLHEPNDGENILELAWRF